MFISKIFERKKSKRPIEKTNIRDRPLKSIIKAISWRIVGTMDTIMISWILTGKIKVAISIGGVEVFSKIFLYFLHERAWESVRWGRMMVAFRRNSRLTKKVITKSLFSFS
ncbi:MAG: DUF2061 domain-containing protein [Bacteroidetes bacterium]|nr:DUF2061 domain-containing protein [Bacteroidota bacterium]